MDENEILFSQIASRDTGLVRHHAYGQSPFIQLVHRTPRAGDQAKFGWCANVVYLMIQCPISIEEHTNAAAAHVFVRLR